MQNYKMMHGAMDWGLKGGAGQEWDCVIPVTSSTSCCEQKSIALYNCIRQLKDLSQFSFIYLIHKPTYTEPHKGKKKEKQIK